MEKLPLMIKYLPLLLILSLSAPSFISAQTPTEAAATASPQVRNRLQLLTNIKLLNRRFIIFHRRLQALIARLRKINTRLEKRLAKLVVTGSINDRLASQISRISLALNNADKVSSQNDSIWQNIVNTQNRDDFLTLKKNLADQLVLLEALVNDQKNLVKEMKKYKAKAVPTAKVTTNSAVTN